MQPARLRLRMNASFCCVGEAAGTIPTGREPSRRREYAVRYEASFNSCG
jgi:hypothetical protein